MVYKVGKILRLKSKGITDIETRTKGDLLVHINIWTPEKINKEQKIFSHNKSTQKNLNHNQKIKNLF